MTVPGASVVNNGCTIGVSDGVGTAGLYPITITPSSGTIGGQPTFVLSSPFSAVVLVCDGNSSDLVIRSSR